MHPLILSALTLGSIAILTYVDSGTEYQVKREVPITSRRTRTVTLTYQGAGQLSRAIRQVLNPIYELPHTAANHLKEWIKNEAPTDPTMELKALKISNAQLQGEQLKLKGLVEENQRLRGLLNFQRSLGSIQSCPIELVGRQRSPLFETLLFEFRASTELSKCFTGDVKGAWVIAHGSLIGVVTASNDALIFVAPISDRSVRVDVILEQTRLRGVTTGREEDNRSLVNVEYLESRTPVRVGERVFAYGNNALHYHQLLIGEVAQVELSQDGLFQEVLILPVIRPDLIHHALLIAPLVHSSNKEKSEP